MGVGNWVARYLLIVADFVAVLKYFAIFARDNWFW